MSPSVLRDVSHRERQAMKLRRSHRERFVEEITPTEREIRPGDQSSRGGVNFVESIKRERALEG
ncbi:hypothetical protein F2Q70_00001669 [Brassica cretica]|uniref:Uncharacterized protein n=1 Tax=Brassica cretica TaxID=69181 RepID=A0A8S9IUG5_BRACR|nr:hypothetical protein F2Q70_00001669 [Brassica cretica]